MTVVNKIMASISLFFDFKVVKQTCLRRKEYVGESNKPWVYDANPIVFMRKGGVGVQGREKKIEF